MRLRPGLPILLRKQLRELRRLAGQVVSIALVMAIGIGLLASSVGTLQALRRASSAFYRDTRFADAFASVERAAASVADSLARLPGVAVVDTRVVLDGRLDALRPDRGTGAGREAAAIRLVSLPDRGLPPLNAPLLVRGEWPRPGEVVVNAGFAIARAVHPGDTLRVVANGRVAAFRVAGVVVSPEYVFAQRAGDFMPDARRFGIAWTPRAPLAAMAGLTGAFNDAAFALVPGVAPARVLADLDSVLAPAGGRGAYARADQVSARMLREEFRQVWITAGVVPVIFLAVSAWLVAVVLGRIVATQRPVIGLLKACGFPTATIARHYAGYALWTGVLGTALGMALGWWLGEFYVAAYQRYFHFPSMPFRFDPLATTAAVVASLGAAGLGAVGAVRRVVALSPAEAMRPEAPMAYRRTWVDRSWLARRLSPRTHMVARHLARQPRRTVLTTLAVSLAMTLLVGIAATWDSLERLLSVEFAQQQREDLAVAFTVARPVGVRHELAALSGVRRVELARYVPVRVTGPGARRTVLLEGREADAELRRLLGTGGRATPLPTDGVLLTAWLAERLGVRAGDTVLVEALEGTRPRRAVAVAGITHELLGGGATMSLDGVAALLGGTPTASVAFLAIDAPARAALVAELEAARHVAAVGDRAAWLRQLRRDLSGRLRTSLLVLVVFASVIAVGVVYNSARIALAERARELASMRVLGFTRPAVAGLFFGELGTQVLLALPVGAVLGALFVTGLTQALSTESYRFPPALALRTVLLSSLVICGAAALSGGLVWRRLGRLHLVEVLKAPE